MPYGKSSVTSKLLPRHPGYVITVCDSASARSVAQSKGDIRNIVLCSLRITVCFLQAERLYCFGVGTRDFYAKAIFLNVKGLVLVISESVTFLVNTT
jgi:hypothetical protein